MNNKKVNSLNCLIMPESDWEIKDPNEKIKLIKELKLEELNKKDEYGFTRLHRDARCTNYSQVISAFKDKGADINVHDKNRRTPLHWAAWENHETFEYSKEKTIVEALLNAGAELDAKDKKGHTPLYFAIKNNISCEVIDALVDANADLKMGTDEKGTLLHLALMNYNKFKGFDIREYYAIRILLKKGVDYNITNAEGKTPLALAIADKNQTAIQILKEAGASE